MINKSKFSLGNIDGVGDLGGESFGILFYVQVEHLIEKLTKSVLHFINVFLLCRVVLWVNHLWHFIIHSLSTHQDNNTQMLYEDVFHRKCLRCQNSWIFEREFAYDMRIWAFQFLFYLYLLLYFLAYDALQGRRAKLASCFIWIFYQAKHWILYQNIEYFSGSVLLFRLKNQTRRYYVMKIGAAINTPSRDKKFIWKLSKKLCKKKSAWERWFA